MKISRNDGPSAFENNKEQGIKSLVVHSPVDAYAGVTLGLLAFEQFYWASVFTQPGVGSDLRKRMINEAACIGDMHPFRPDPLSKALVRPN